MDQRILNRVILRVSLFVAASAVGFAFLATADDPAHAAEPSRPASQGLLAGALNDLAETADDPGALLKGPTPVKGAGDDSADAPDTPHTPSVEVGHRSTKVLAPLTKSISRPVARALDEAPQPASEPTGRAQRASSRAVRDITATVDSLAPQLTPVTEAVLDPIQPLLHTVVPVDGVDVELPTLPALLPPLLDQPDPVAAARPSPPQATATVESQPLAPLVRPAAGPSTTAEADTAGGPLSQQRSTVADAPPGPRLPPAPAPLSAPDGPAGIAGQQQAPVNAAGVPGALYSPPSMLDLPLVDGEPHRLAGRAPKPSPGPA